MLQGFAAKWLIYLRCISGALRIGMQHVLFN